MKLIERNMEMKLSERNMDMKLSASPGRIFQTFLSRKIGKRTYLSVRYVTKRLKLEIGSSESDAFTIFTGFVLNPGSKITIHAPTVACKLLELDNRRKPCLLVKSQVYSFLAHFIAD